MPEILPSLLAADFGHLAEQIALVEAAGVRMLHLDVMDGHFVPNISFGLPVVSAVRKLSRSVLDVHLMITEPDRYLAAFRDAGADQILVHYEACPHLDRTLDEIRRLGAKAGVVLNPATPVSVLENVLGVADIVLIMSVNPGFGGQKFIPYALNKVRALERARTNQGLDFAIEIDGGITAQNVAAAAEAGVDWFVAGSSVFGSADPAAAVRNLHELAAGPHHLRKA
ncbi:MAG: ribulose-phosphate 3-epimerase [Bryobacteraceae bacterium]|nr:ribulose-phosphate 3-epimerase [Bryobacteraceae bacterium]